MLLEQGYGTQEANWFVDEKKGPGFCRVYYLESGSVFFHDEAGLQQLTPETLYIFPSHAPFSIRHQPSHPICCLWYHLNLFPIMVTSLIKIAVSCLISSSTLLSKYSRASSLESPAKRSSSATCLS